MKLVQAVQAAGLPEEFAQLQLLHAVYCSSRFAEMKVHLGLIWDNQGLSSRIILDYDENTPIFLMLFLSQTLWVGRWLHKMKMCFMLDIRTAGGGSAQLLKFPQTRITVLR